MTVGVPTDASIDVAKLGKLSPMDCCSLILFTSGVSGDCMTSSARGEELLSDVSVISCSLTWTLLLES